MLPFFMINFIKAFKLQKNLIIRFSGQEVRLPLSVRAKINRYWQVLIGCGKPYRRGEIYTIATVHKSKDLIEVIVDKTDYAHYLYSKNIGTFGKYAVRIIHPSALVISCDGKIILGEMGKQTAGSNTFQLCGGGIDNSDLQDTAFNLEHCISKELFEEFGINSTDTTRVAKFEREYVVMDRLNHKITIVYLVLLKEKASEFLKKYKVFALSLSQKKELPEFKRIVIISLKKYSIMRFLQKNAPRCHEHLKPLFEFLLQ